MILLGRILNFHWNRRKSTKIDENRRNLEISVHFWRLYSFPHVKKLKFWWKNPSKARFFRPSRKKYLLDSFSVTFFRPTQKKTLRDFETYFSGFCEKWTKKRRFSHQIFGNPKFTDFVYFSSIFRFLWRFSILPKSITFRDFRWFSSSKMMHFYVMTRFKF